MTVVSTKIPALQAFGHTDMTLAWQHFHTTPFVSVTMTDDMAFDFLGKVT